MGGWYPSILMIIVSNWRSLCPRKHEHSQKQTSSLLEAAKHGKVRLWWDFELMVSAVFFQKNKLSLGLEIDKQQGYQMHNVFLLPLSSSIWSSPLAVPVVDRPTLVWTTWQKLQVVCYKYITRQYVTIIKVLIHQVKHSYVRFHLVQNLSPYSYIYM